MNSSKPSIYVESVIEMEQGLITMKNWMDSNKLKMNESKTEFLVVGSRHRKKVNVKSFKVVEDTVNRSDYIRLLGAWLDEVLTFKKHIDNKCRTAMINLMRIKHIRKFLTKEATESLVLGTVISHIDYCNSILYGLPDCEIQKMQRVQNISAKLVLGLS